MVAKTQQAQAVVAAIFLLAIGQLFVIGLGWARGLTLQDAIRSIARERRAADEKYNKSFVTAKLFENEIADLKRRMGLSEKEIQEEMAAMRAQFQGTGGTLCGRRRQRPPAATAAAACSNSEPGRIPDHAAGRTGPRAFQFSA